MMTMTLADARDALRARKTSAAELAETCLTAIGTAAALNIVTDQDTEQARAAAARADQRLAEGDAPDLCGIPIGITDMFARKGQPLGAASAILQGFRPPYESGVTERLDEAGAVMIGTLNQDEFGMGALGETSTHGPAVNPWRATEDHQGENRLSPGADSGGAALAAGLALGTVGHDGGGTVRQGAALTAMVGLRPTYGRISRHGMIAVASSLDQAGLAARTVQDAAILLAALAGHDPRDPTSSARPAPDCQAALAGNIKGRRIGIPREYRFAGLDDDAAKAWDLAAEHLTALGAEPVEVSLPHAGLAMPVHHVIAAAEASSNLARFDGVRFGHRAEAAKGDGIAEMYEKSRAEGFGPEVQHRLLLGTHLLSAAAYEERYQRARRIRRLIRQDFDAVHADGVDAILTPATPSSAVALGRVAEDAGPESRLSPQVMQLGASLAGLPAITLPAALDAGGLPLGVQLIGRPWDEAGLLAIAHALEKAIGFTGYPRNWWQAEEGNP